MSCFLYLGKHWWRSSMRGNINGAIKASAIVALLIAAPPVLIAMTYDDYPKYCKLSILLPCIGVNDE